ncbi:unnamed protein product, partial [Amoebophrya sp. A120]
STHSADGAVTRRQHVDRSRNSRIRVDVSPRARETDTNMPPLIERQNKTTRARRIFDEDQRDEKLRGPEQNQDQFQQAAATRRTFKLDPRFERSNRRITSSTFAAAAHAKTERSTRSTSSADLHGGRTKASRQRRSEYEQDHQESVLQVVEQAARHDHDGMKMKKRSRPMGLTSRDQRVLLEPHLAASEDFSSVLREGKSRRTASVPPPGGPGGILAGSKSSAASSTYSLRGMSREEYYARRKLMY